ncbi:hypothetical protein [Paenibacillus peoriae]|uniref:hypothetical protein n=1 Tax=Paenibacillus peoriae TaxID=59893 RepID=UPI0015C38CE4|nr:hypothetical protein [Paenibacillus peoriae]
MTEVKAKKIVVESSVRHTFALFLSVVMKDNSHRDMTNRLRNRLYQEVPEVRQYEVI